MTTKKVILLSAATYFALNTIIWLIGWLTWPAVFLGAWIFLGCVARKVSSYGIMKDDWAWNYILCNLFPPVVLIEEVGENCENILANLKRDYNIDPPSLPKFRNPFVWPEKEGK